MRPPGGELRRTYRTYRIKRNLPDRCGGWPPNSPPGRNAGEQHDWPSCFSIEHGLFDV